MSTKQNVRDENGDVPFTWHGVSCIVNMSICLESYPCQHYVSLAGYSPELLDGRTIANMMLESKTPINPHFQDYLGSEDDDWLFGIFGP